MKIEHRPSGGKDFYYLEFDNGDYYTGGYVNGKLNGYGIYTWADGSVYAGNFIDNQRTGLGKTQWPGGSFYEGEYLGGDFHGKGTYTWANGEQYVGDFVHNKRTGSGKYTWTDGAMYIGGYFDGKCDGFGKYIHSDGEVFEGRYKDGMRHGEGTVTYPDGRKEKLIYEFNKIVSREPIETTRTLDINSLGSWDDIKSGKAKQQSLDASKRVSKLNELFNVFLHPWLFESFSDPSDRNIERSCMFLEKYITEAEQLFLDNKLRQSADRLGEILGYNFGTDANHWIYDEQNEYFSSFICGAFNDLSNKDTDSLYNADRIISAATNIACYMWEKYDVDDVLFALRTLWEGFGKDDEGANFLWICRMSENGDYTVKSETDDVEEDIYGLDVDSMTMGSDGKLFDPFI